MNVKPDRSHSQRGCTRPAYRGNTVVRQNSVCFTTWIVCWHSNPHALLPWGTPEPVHSWTNMLHSCRISLLPPIVTERTSRGFEFPSNANVYECNIFMFGLELILVMWAVEYHGFPAFWSTCYRYVIWLAHCNLCLGIPRWPGLVGGECYLWGIKESLWL